jgi:hypothetical protein
MTLVVANNGMRTVGLDKPGSRTMMFRPSCPPIEFTDNQNISRINVSTDGRWFYAVLKDHAGKGLNVVKKYRIPQ